MYVAWRDLRFARGRFILIAAVVALITFLVAFLAGLTGGLASQNISAVLALPGDQVVLQAPKTDQASYSESTISAKVEAAFRDASGVSSVTPVGITQARIGSTQTPVSVTAIGLGESPTATALTDLRPRDDSHIGLSEAAATQLGVGTGDDIGIAGRTYTVSTVGADLWYSHTPVIAMDFTAWHQLDKQLGGSGRATVLTVSSTHDLHEVAAATGTTTESPVASLTALDTFKSEVGSLGLMIVMLFGISALVVGAFFTVWTMQRASDVAILKALGASSKSLVTDALAQAAIVLIAGVALGLGAVLLMQAVVPDALPFLLSPLTTLAPSAAMALLGLAGAAFALRNVTHADPLTALGSNR